MRGKGSQIYAEIDVKIDDKSMRFRNLRFLDFCEEYNVKLLFSHDQGHQKSIETSVQKHLRNIDAEVIENNGILIPRWSQNVFKIN